MGLVLIFQREEKSWFESIRIILWSQIWYCYTERRKKVSPYVCQNYMNDDIHPDHGYLDTWDIYSAPPKFIFISFVQTKNRTYALVWSQGFNWTAFYFQVFDHQGSFLSYINTTADPLYGPQGLAITEEGNVVVGDSGNHCFKIYRYLQ